MSAKLDGETAARTDAYATAREILREYERQHASVVRWQIGQILDIIDQRIERALQSAQTLYPVPGHDGEGRIAGHAGDTGKVAFEERQLGGNEAAHGIDPDLKKIEAVLDRRQAAITVMDSLGHRHSPVADGKQPILPADAGHRLSGGAK